MFKSTGGKIQILEYVTEDGFTFFVQPDGIVTDQVNPKLSDMVFPSLTDLAQFVSVKHVNTLEKESV